MRRSSVLVIAIAMLVLVLPQTARGQCNVAITNPPSGSCSQNTNVTLNVQAVARMTVNAYAGLGNPTIANYEDGFRDVAGPTITVKANVPWTITIRGTTATWQSTDDPMSGEAARIDKPVGDLRYSVTGGPPFTALTSSIGGSTLTTGAATNDSLIATYFRTLWDFGLDTPGTYELIVTFTIVAS